MGHCKSGVLALAAITLAALPARAQDSKPVEITPYLGFGTVGAFPVGTAVTFPVTSTLSVEADVAYRRAEGDINALSTSYSLLWFLPRAGRAKPYLAGGVGLAQYGAPVLFRGRPIATQTGLALTMNAGGGVKTTINSRVDLRSDARWFKSFGKQGSDQFRVAQGISFGAAKR